MSLTAKAIKDYLANGGTRCPGCLSTEISGSSMQVDNDTAWQEIECANCEQTWTDIYKLKEIVET